MARKQRPRYVRGNQKNIKINRTSKGAGVVGPGNGGGVFPQPDPRKNYGHSIEGTGLGLAIVKHIAIRHKAELKITSKVNVGTTIEISFKKS